MKIGRIAYLNTEPFFFHWSDPQFELVSGVPRVLAQAAYDGDIVASPLPIVDCWNLEGTYTSLGPWGIATRESSRSVLVLSNRPFRELNNVTIGVTRESSTSVRLCEVLIKRKYNHQAVLKRGMRADDDAWLLIGDQALQIWGKPPPGTWTHVTDLSTEWWEWKRLPFVFARWVVRRDLPLYIKSLLIRHLQECLEKGRESLLAIGAQQAPKLGLPIDDIEAYLKGFNYVIGREEEEAIRIFRDLAQSTSSELTLTRL